MSIKIRSLILASHIVNTLLFASPVSAQVQPTRIPLPSSPTGSTFTDSSILPGLFITRIFNSVVIILGFITVYYMVLASIRLIISKGDPEKVADARSRLIYAVVGFIVLLLSYAAMLIVDRLFLNSNVGIS